MIWKLTIVNSFDQGDGFEEHTEIYEDSSLIGLIIPFLNAIYDGVPLISLTIEQVNE